MSEAMDTSVVLRLLTGEPAAQAESARRHIEQSEAPVSVDALVVGESYFALRHHYAVPHRKAVEALLVLLGSERVLSLPHVRAALAAAKDREPPGVMDRLILAAAEHDGRALLTFDRGLARVPGARMVR